MKFVDEAVIEIHSGRGGSGAVHFLSQRGRPKMGPDGGNGGRGGHVILRADRNLHSLLDFKFIKTYKAKNGENGSSRDCDGKKGEDLILSVPIGTVVEEVSTGRIIVDLKDHDQESQILKGGRGGLGNMNFATSVNQAPKYAQPGEENQSLEIRFSLKLLADVALVGFPNAGKSSLISRVSAAKPKIADYAFTTLIPNLGMIKGKTHDFVLADVPGLIERASEGKGLGTRFLKHCERSRVLLYLLDLDPLRVETLKEQFKILNNELSKFSEDLKTKPFMVAINKCDFLGDFENSENKVLYDELMLERDLDGLVDLLKEHPYYLSETKKPFYVSAVSGLNVDTVLMDLELRVEEQRQIEKVKEDADSFVVGEDTD